MAALLHRKDGEDFYFDTQIFVSFTLTDFHIDIFFADSLSNNGLYKTV